jgi:hypothetical protein
MTTPLQDSTFLAALQAYVEEITAPTSLTDSSGNVWSFGAVSSDGVNYTILQNGTGWPTPSTAGTGTELALSGGLIYALHGTTWYSATSGSWFPQSAAPSPITASITAS